MIRVIQLRLVAGTKADAQAALDMLAAAVGANRISLESARVGRKGGYIVYGTLSIDSENSRYAAERAAATGETTKLPKRSL